MTITKEEGKASKGSSELGGPQRQLRGSKKQLGGPQRQLRGPQRHVMRAQTQRQLRASEAAKMATKALEPAERT